MTRYFCVFRDQSSGNRWSFSVRADSFAEALEKCEDSVSVQDFRDLISITKDYE